jgi:regulator of RNase E activity RraA
MSGPTDQVDRSLLAALRGIDTPTVCNALERLDPETASHGFTRRMPVCRNPESPPIVGPARTARIRASRPSGRSAAAAREVDLAYFRHVAEGPGPTITVIEDLDEPACCGAWWGEVHTHVHRGLGSLGVVTNGIVRDWDQMADGFQVLAGDVGPSHAHVHVVDFGGPVEVFGMRVRPGDWIHADRHGAVAIPPGLLPHVAEAAAAVVRDERVLIEASREPGFDIEVLERLLRGAGH